MQFYIFVMLLGLPDDIHEEKPSFLQFKKNALRTDRPTDRRTDRPSYTSYRDARTHLKKNQTNLSLSIRPLFFPRAAEWCKWQFEPCLLSLVFVRPRVANFTCLYRSARNTRCEEAKIAGTPPYSPNAWAELAQILGGWPLGGYFQGHRGDF